MLSVAQQWPGRFYPVGFIAGALFLLAVQAKAIPAIERDGTLLSASPQHDGRRSPSRSPMTTKKPTAETRQPTTPPPRDPQLAIEEEFEAAKRQGTSEAYDLFIARHPDSPRAAEARRLREPTRTER
jgi:hypothetical protein